MNYTELVGQLKEIGLDTDKMGRFAQNGECTVYDNHVSSELDVMGILEQNFGKVEIVDTSYFHDGYECWCVYAFKDLDIYMRVDGFFSS